MEIVQDIKPDVLVDIRPDVLVDIKSNIALIEKAASTLESRFAARAIRQTALIRHSLTQEIIDSVVALLPGYSLDPALLTDSAISTTSETSNVLLYVGYLLLVFMHDTKSPQGPSLANRLVQIIQAQNKRSLDLIASRIYFYWARFYELSNSLPQIFPYLVLIQSGHGCISDCCFAPGSQYPGYTHQRPCCLFYKFELDRSS